MLFKTEDEIRNKVNELWHEWSCKPDDIDINIYSDCITIKLSAMYRTPGLSFQKLLSLSEFFQTKNINDDEHYSHAGCETCDYGSEYGFTLTVRPE